MIVPGSVNPLLLGGGEGYTIARSVRFRSSANAYLNRTPTVAGNRKTWTWSGWTKRGNMATGAAQFLFSARSGSPWGGIVLENSTGQLQITFTAGVSGGTYTSAYYRDPSAWYHIVVAVDTTQATAADRVKVYVNGVQITSFSSTNYPSQNFDTQFNSTIAHYLGCSQSSTENVDGYMTEVNFVDGQALTPSSFGATDAITGVWQPTAYTGTYGTNGFYLTFGNNTSTTTLGYDTSPQGNNWTTNNISLTAGTTYDSMLDVPTLTSATVANYATLNPLSKTGQTISNGNLTFSSSAGTSGQAAAPTFAVGSSGKWYWEVQITTTPQNQTEECIGVVNDIGTPATLQRAYNSAGQYFNGTSWVAYGSAWAINDVIGIAIDVTNSQITFYKNNTSQGVKTFAWNANGNCTLRLGSSAATTYQANFGQRPFTYTPPSGFVALNTYNLSTPTIPNGAVYMAATTYTGTGATQVVTNTVNGTNFQPDWVWIKNRVGAISHSLYDVVRGAGYRLSSNETTAELNYTAQMTGFNSNGFSVATNNNEVNESGTNYVGWQWKANGTGVTNTSGSITSTVSANTTAGFSVATYTGNGTSGATVGHGLGVAPSLIIAKVRSRSGDSWHSYHVSLGGTQGILLNSTNAASTDAGFWNNTNPSGTVFTVGTYNTFNTQTYVAYVFAAIAGYSAFGSYTGNGSTDGPFVFLGFRPRFVIIKRTDTTNNWHSYTSTIDPYNVVAKTLYPNLSNAEATENDLDFVSNGMKMRDSGTHTNASGGTYIYMAWAENPFKYSLAR